MKRIILPNVSDYINYISNIILESYVDNIPTNSKVNPTTEVAVILVDEEGYLVLDETKEE